MSAQQAKLNAKQTTIIELNKSRLQDRSVTTERELQPSSKPFTGDEDEEIYRISNAHTQDRKATFQRKPTAADVQTVQK